MTLAMLKADNSATVTALRGDGALLFRLREMGFVPGAKVRMLGAAPLGDPLIIRLGGYTLALRRCAANKIIIGDDLRC